MDIGKITDTQRLNWLEKQEGGGLLSDDNGHWAVSGSGLQNIPSSDGTPAAIASTFFVEKGQWESTIRRAIDKAMGE